jgi:hypothetical protein
LNGTISKQTLEPTVFPIDWTLNPICGFKGQVTESSLSEKVGGLSMDSSTSSVNPSSAAGEGADNAPFTGTGIDVALQDQSDTIPVAADGGEGGDIPGFNCSNNVHPTFKQLVAGAPYDYILLTDCVFSEKLAVPLVNTILSGCGPRSTIFCCHEIRDEVRKKAVLFSYWCLFITYIA